MWNYKSFLCVIVSILLFRQCNTQEENDNENESSPIKMIFETDIGNDIDDALALNTVAILGYMR